MSLELPVISPPRVKAFNWRVPVEEIMLVPPPLKVNPPPDVVTRILLKSASAARRPLAMSKEPAKDEEPVPFTVKSPDMVWSPARLKLPDILAPPPNDAVPLTSRSPEIRRPFAADM